MNHRPDLEFLSTGLLPARPLIHPVTLAELHEYFVERFPQSQTRARLYNNLMRYLKILNVFVGLHGVLVNGSYVTAKVNPRDIDISPVIDGMAFKALSLDHQKAVEHLIDHNSGLPQILRCHSFYTVFVYPEGHRLRRENNTTFQNGKAFWSRAKGGKEKGFLFLNLKTK